jgi:hypothetical protein
MEVSQPRIPTGADDWRLMARTTRLVLSIPVYAVLASVVAVVALTLFVGSQNVTLVGDLVVGGTLPLDSRLTILFELYPFVGTDYTLANGSLLVLASVLIGVNVAMATYHFREHGIGLQEGSGSIAGVLLATLGAGCAACGSAVLVGLLSLVGATVSLTVLPLHGLEFVLLALGAVLLSIYWLADGMRGGTVAGCPVDPGW